MRSRLGLPSVRGRLPLVVALTVDALGTGLFLPFSILFFTVTTPLSVAKVGLGISIASALRLPFGPLLGSLVDRTGAYRVLLLSNVVQAIGVTGYLLVGSFAGLVSASFVVLLGNSAFWASYPPLVTQISAPGERERWFGFLGALRNTGFAVGGVLSGVAVSVGGSAGYHLVAAVNATSFAVAALFLLGSRPPDLPPDRRPAGPAIQPGTAAGGVWRTVLGDRPYLALAVINVAFATSTLALTVVMPVYAVANLGLPPWLPGAAFSVNCVLVAVGQGPVVVALGGRSRVWSLQLASALVAASAVVMLLASVVPPVAAAAMVVLGVVVFTGGELIDSPVMAALSSEAAPDELRGRYLSVYQLSWNVSSTVGPALLTGLLSLGALPVWAAVALIAIAGWIGIARLAPRLAAARHRIGTAGASP